MRRCSMRVPIALLMACVGGMAQADVLANETNLVGIASNPAPSQHTFTAASAEALTVTLTDFQSPAAFAALQIAVTLGDTLVGSASVDATHTATVPVPAAAGNYTIYVVGAPDAAQGFGTFGVCVTRNSDPTPRTCDPTDSYSDSITVPAAPSSGGASPLDVPFTSTSAGVYTVTISDDAFPAALASLSAIITNGSTQIGGVFASGNPTPVTLAGGTTYTLLAAATLGSAPAGLYGIRITDPSGAAVFDRSFPVGTLAAATIVNNPSPQPLSVTLTDFSYPAPLAALSIAVTAGGALVASLPAAGTLAGVASPAGSLDVWTYAAAGSEPGVYSLNLSSASATLLSSTRVINPGNASSAGSFGFVVDLPAAGQYQLSVSDFAFPAALQSLSATIAQNGAVLAQSSNGDFTGAAGMAIILVMAQAPQSGNGIFDVAVQSTGTAPQVILDQTQAVGGAFTTQTINLGTSGGYEVTLADLGFPQDFLNLAVVVSKGGQLLGKIFGGGSFPFTGTPGAQYVLTFVATPNTANGSGSLVPGYGLYSLNVASSLPSLSFTSSVTSVPAGGTTTLTWSSQNATACSASGGSEWTGPQMTSGTTAVAVSAAETLSLTCTGPGGSASQSVMVMPAAAPASGGGGGGSIDLFELLTVLAVSMGGVSRRRPVRLPPAPCRSTFTIPS